MFIIILDMLNKSKTNWRRINYTHGAHAREKETEVKLCASIS